MAVLVLSDDQRRKWDSSDDALFYSQPRFVQHLDEAFRQRLTALYRERLPADAVVLDLMSSWVSHLPEEITYRSVIGHGLNAEELQRNPPAGASLGAEPQHRSGFATGRCQC